MKRIFKFKEGQAWDGDEEIIHFIEEVLLPDTWENFPKIKQDTKITLIVEKFPSKPRKNKGGN